MRKLRMHPCADGMCGAILTVALCGCETTRSQGTGPDAYSIRALEMEMVVPPREDIRVGDMFVYSSDPETIQYDDEGLAVRSSLRMRWATLPVADDLEAEYQQRGVLPKTPDAFLQASPDPSARTWPEMAVAEGSSIFSHAESVNRLPIVTVEALTTTTLTLDELDELIPTEAISLTLGPAWKTMRGAYARVSSAESCTLPLSVLVAELLEPTAGGEPGKYVIREEYRNDLALFAGEDANRVWVRVVSEVLYIRSIDVGLRGTIDVADADELGELPKGDTKMSPLDADPAVAAFARAHRINQHLAEMNADIVPGGMVRFLAVTDEWVSVRRMWERGLALGVGGLTIEVDTDTGDVISLGFIGRSTKGFQ